ncbi:MAG TPA: polyprenyl synthetase family protein [Rhodothermales bacterium]|nr:polyprenyl synthetase family protein [Rhodothermales bacterium]
MSNTDLAPAPAKLVPRRDVSLKEIQRTVEDELATFQTYFRDAMRSRVGLLDKVTQYVLRQKGKRIRPILVLLSAKVCGGVTDTTYRAAALVELLHTATLVHDDVVDEAERRRGVFSINALWKNKIAVLLGDFLLSRGLLLSLDNNDYQLLHILSDSVRRMSEGELLQIEKARRLDIDEETYFRIISDKTASLIAACTSCGAYSAVHSQHADDDQDAIDRMRSLGENLGLAFQIRDDLFDYGAMDVGKPLGIDLQEKKLTLPLIYALRNAEKSERKRVMKIIRKKKKSRADTRTVAQFVEAQGGISYARDKMEGFAQEARALLATFPPTPARDTLRDLIDFTVQRQK